MLIGLSNWLIAGLLPLSLGTGGTQGAGGTLFGTGKAVYFNERGMVSMRTASRRDILIVLVLSFLVASCSGERVGEGPLSIELTEVALDVCQPSPDPLNPFSEFLFDFRATNTGDRTIRLERVEVHSAEDPETGEVIVHGDLVFDEAHAVLEAGGTWHFSCMNGVEVNAPSRFLREEYDLSARFVFSYTDDGTEGMTSLQTMLDHRPQHDSCIPYPEHACY
jgi:hypothetical protein